MKREREEMEHPSEPPLSPVSETTGAQGSWLRRKRKDLLVSFVFLLLAGALVGAGHDAYLWFRKSPTPTSIRSVIPSEESTFPPITAS